MASTSRPKLWLLHLLLLLSCTAMSSPLDDDRRPYIIHMDPSAMPVPFSTHKSWHTSILSSLPSPPDAAPPDHLYTYSHVMHGFSAVLSSAHVEHLARMPGHVAIHPDSYGRLHTTHTPKFLGLSRHSGLWPMSGFGDDMIIGLVDSGIWPESDSFDDKGMPPIPERWKGTCETGTKFNSSNCNRKLIGARYFGKGQRQRGLNVSKTLDYDSPRDSLGHGTHTSSTAAGARSPGADYFEYAEGNAIGIAPMARLAMYKVSPTSTDELAASDVLAGMEQAIADGVDLLSLSLGFAQTPYHSNVIALGAFAAMEKGIFVSCSAGNDGPDGYTIYNGAPWITTVGAGTIDRDYVASITLGQDFATVRGNSFYPVSLYISGVPLYYGLGDARKENCRRSSLDAKDVDGTVVFCSYSIENDVKEQMDEVVRSGARGAIIATDQWPFMDPTGFGEPLVVVAPEEEKVIKAYVAKTKGQNLTVVDIVFQLTEVGTPPAPQVADFSSRGPYAISPEILKPDILAPGVNVLAAWARGPLSSLTSVGHAPLISDYMLLSGTSMASPHVVGVAALLRSLHREWSPAAIRSAIMTTADVLDTTHQPIADLETGLPATPLDFGAGHINPNKAKDPGLIYDIGLQDYVDFLCGLNYSSSEIRVITRRSDYTCQANLDLNYPSFIVVSDRKASIARRSFKRVLTSVMDGPSIYRAMVAAPAGMRVVVEPQTLAFDGKYSRQEFSVSVEVEVGSDSQGSYGFLSWSEVGGKHVVRSPMAFAFAPNAK